MKYTDVKIGNIIEINLKHKHSLLEKLFKKKEKQCWRVFHINDTYVTGRILKKKDKDTYQETDFISSVSYDKIERIIKTKVEKR